MAGDPGNPTTLVLTPTEAARALGVTSGTLASWRQQGTGPAYIRLSYHTIAYRPADLEAWLTARRVEAAPEEPKPRGRATRPSAVPDR